MSGAGMSFSAPIVSAAARMYARDTFSSSRSDIFLGSHSTPPLLPPSGKSTTAVFHVIHDASALIVSTVSSG